MLALILAAAPITNDAKTIEGQTLLAYCSLSAQQTNTGIKAVLKRQFFVVLMLQAVMFLSNRFYPTPRGDATPEAKTVYWRWLRTTCFMVFSGHSSS